MEMPGKLRKENAMKNRILRILISAALFSLACGGVVLLIGLVLGWKTSTQFSDGFFLAGSIMIAVGLVNVLGSFSQRSVSGLRYSQSAVHLDMAERSRIWTADILHGYNLLGFLVISGLLQFGLSALAILIGGLIQPAAS
jgi:hypothetical protein